MGHSGHKHKRDNAMAIYNKTVIFKGAQADFAHKGGVAQGFFQMQGESTLKIIVQISNLKRGVYTLVAMGQSTQTIGTYSADSAGKLRCTFTASKGTQGLVVCSVAQGVKIVLFGFVEQPAANWREAVLRHSSPPAKTQTPAAPVRAVMQPAGSGQSPTATQAAQGQSSYVTNGETEHPVPALSAGTQRDIGVQIQDALPELPNVEWQKQFAATDANVFSGSTTQHHYMAVAGAFSLLPPAGMEGSVFYPGQGGSGFWVKRQPLHHTPR